MSEKEDDLSSTPDSVTFVDGTMPKSLPISLRDVIQAHKRIAAFIHRTPVFTNSTFDQLFGRKFYFKAENLQKTGSFKARGALNAIQRLRENPESAVNGVVTHSSGNHGQALAWAAKMSGLKCTVVVPNNSPEVKLTAIKGYGADIVVSEPFPDARQSACDKVARELGYHYVPPFDHYDVIAGQGTIGLEFLEQVPDLDAILIPASGGGMTSGIAIATKSQKKDLKIFIVEPEGKDVQRCMMAGERLWPNPPGFLNTIADGIRMQQLGQLTWPIILELAEKEVFTMNDEEIIRGMKFAFQRMKLVIEAASGASVAAAMSDKLRAMDPSMKNVGVILCGGNVDIDHLPWYTADRM